MSNNDAMQDTENLESEQALDDANNQATEVESTEAVAAEVENAESEVEEYEVVLRDQEPSPEKEQKKRNAAAAKQRIEAKEAKKRAEAAEEQLRQIKNGDIPEHLKESLVISPDLPSQPSPDDYFSDEALEKYGYDKDRANAAFTQASNNWLMEAQNARSTSQANEAKARTDFIAQQQQQIERSQAYSKTASEMNIQGFDDAEKSFIESSGAGAGAIDFVNDVFGDEIKTSVAVINYLGRNPDEVKRIIALPPSRQIAEISRLGYSKLELRKKERKIEPEADTNLDGGGSSPKEGWKKDLAAALASGDNDKFRTCKQEWERKLGRSIAYSEIR